MRPVLPLLTAVVLAGSGVAGAQGLLPRNAVQHATVATSASASAVVPGSKLTLYADVTPYPAIHIYAEGATEFTPVSLAITPTGAVTAGKVAYPKPDVAKAPGSTEAVPAYRKTFRIAVPVTVKASATRGETLTVGGAVTYQACDDRLCYPVTAAPVSWTLSVK
jgi:hypothetical protein